MKLPLIIENKKLVATYRQYLRLRDILEETAFLMVFDALFTERKGRTLTAIAMRCHYDVRTIQRYGKRFLSELKILEKSGPWA